MEAARLEERCTELQRVAVQLEAGKAWLTSLLDDLLAANGRVRGKSEDSALWAFRASPLRDDIEHRTIPGTSVVLQGLLETFDPRSVGSQVRAALEGPGFAWNLTGYALKNASYIGGYMLDLASVPAEWWPHNRVVLRLSAERIHEMRRDETQLEPPALGTRLAGVPFNQSKARGLPAPLDFR